ncbi:serine protease HTRA2, mitochondrial-like isoform X2 [Artemia franciscana]|uniref:serine protease HTRA2, mitochondrial-like isoform X2 n=1 Tax=Artemia franciscana TaxID=6661 RepID=UPI0032D9EA26
MTPKDWINLFLKSKPAFRAQTFIESNHPYQTKWKSFRSYTGLGVGLLISWTIYKNRYIEINPWMQNVKTTKWFLELPSVLAAVTIEEPLEEDINKLDPKSKAHEIESLDMRKDHNFIADVVERTAPAVVYIEIKDSRRKDYFGKPATLSNGSGFIVKEDGLILTNAHVVVSRPYARVHVKLYDGRTFEGYVEDVDVRTDLATIRIPCFGNSGGPLVNLDGVAVGINSMKVTSGISFAIPIDYGKKFLKAAEERKVMEGKTSWFGTKKKQDVSLSKGRYMGVTMLPLSPQLMHELQVRGSDLAADVTHGVLIWKVVVGSPAHSGGLLPGDVVTAVNGEPVVVAEDIYEALKQPGNLVLDVSRKREKMKLTIAPENP